MEEFVSMQKVIALWDKYHPTIAVNAIEYDAELRKLPTVNQESIETQSSDLISRRVAIDIVAPYDDNRVMRDALEELSPAQLEIVKCKDCKYWNSGYCECPEPVINTEAEHFCGYADRREATE